MPVGVINVCTCFSIELNEVAGCICLLDITCILDSLEVERLLDFLRSTLHELVFSGNTKGCVKNELSELCPCDSKCDWSWSEVVVSHLKFNFTEILTCEVSLRVESSDCCELDTCRKCSSCGVITISTSLGLKCECCLNTCLLNSCASEVSLCSLINKDILTTEPTALSVLHCNSVSHTIDNNIKDRSVRNISTLECSTVKCDLDRTSCGSINVGLCNVDKLCCISAFLALIHHIILVCRVIKSVIHWPVSSVPTLLRITSESCVVPVKVVSLSIGVNRIDILD